jgi:hypothetical protein
MTANLRYTRDSSKDATNEVNQIQGGIAYPLSEQTTLSLQHAVRNGTHLAANTTTGAAAGDDSAQSLTSIGLYHSLSKTAGLYAILNRASNYQNLFYSGGATSATGSMTGLAFGAVKNF